MFSALMNFHNKENSKSVNILNRLGWYIIIFNFNQRESCHSHALFWAIKDIGLCRRPGRSRGDWKGGQQRGSLC